MAARCSMSPEMRKKLAAEGVARAIRRRDRELKDFQGDKRMCDMTRQDCKDLKKVYSLFKSGKFEAARVAAEGLDTVVREAVIDPVWDAITNR